MSTDTLGLEVVGSPDVVGERLASARLNKGWSVEQAALAMKVPAHVVATLEAGSWQKLGAPVFIRGQLRSYARLLGLDADALVGQASVEQCVRVDLVSHVRPQRLKMFTADAGRKLAYALGAIALIALVTILVRFPFGGHPQVASLDDFELEAPSQVQSGPAVVDAARTMAVLPRVLPADVAENEKNAPQERAVADGVMPAQGKTLELEFAGQSWVEVHANTGEVIERAMLQPGQTRTYSSSEIGRVLLGNATQVSARLNGAPLDLAPLRRSNVARFTVSSDGSVSPVAN